MTGGQITKTLTKKIEVHSSRSDQQGNFGAVEVNAGTFVKMMDTQASSAISCAMDCIKVDFCSTFMIEDGVCRLGGHDWLP